MSHRRRVQHYISSLQQQRKRRACLMRLDKLVAGEVRLGTCRRVRRAYGEEHDATADVETQRYVATLVLEVPARTRTNPLVKNGLQLTWMSMSKCI